MDISVNYRNGKSYVKIHVNHTQCPRSSGTTTVGVRTPQKLKLACPTSQRSQRETKHKNAVRKCTHCAQLILRKISKIGATRCQVLRLKCTKFDFRWGSAPGCTGPDCNAPPEPLAVFKRPTSKGRKGEGQRGKTGCSWILVGTCKKRWTPTIFETWLGLD